MRALIVYFLVVAVASALMLWMFGDMSPREAAIYATGLFIGIGYEYARIFALWVTGDREW